MCSNLLSYKFICKIQSTCLVFLLVATFIDHTRQIVNINVNFFIIKSNTPDTLPDYGNDQHLIKFHEIK